mmetsp:Transcript_29101/g.93865  ORF Transcript_29101/g.93865 Transcript_29101/m.93865 type:complete len:171 (+) Transcript_29101:1103-1615(+)
MEEDGGQSDYFCTVCGQPGVVLACDGNYCCRVYHPSCLGLLEQPHDEMWCGPCCEPPDWFPQHFPNFVCDKCDNEITGNYDMGLVVCKERLCQRKFCRGCFRAVVGAHETCFDCGNLPTTEQERKNFRREHARTLLERKCRFVPPGFDGRQLSRSADVRQQLEEEEEEEA